MRPLVSVVITSYNYANFIRTAIDSALNQDYPNVEVVVTDNQSTDDTVPMLRETYAGEPRLRINVNPTNVGIMANANKGISLAKGEYVVILSADDYLLPQHTSRLVALSEQHPECPAVYGNAVFTDMNGELHNLRNVWGQVPVAYSDGRNELPRLLCACYMCLPSMLFPRKTFERFGGFDERLAIASDWALSLRIASEGEHFAYTPVPVAAVRMHPGQRSTWAYIEAGDELRESLNLLEWYLVPEQFKRYHRYEHFILQSLHERVKRLVDAKPENYTEDLKKRVSDVSATLKAGAYAPTNRERPRIGIVIPANGRIPPLNAALRSLAHQTYDNWEAVVIANGCTDLEPCIQAQGLGKKVRSYHSAFDLKPASARNVGIALVDADYIMFLDDDDEIAPDHLASMLEVVRQTDARFVMSGSTISIDEYLAGTIARRNIGRAPDLRPLAVSVDELQSINCLPLGAAMFEASLVYGLSEFKPEFGILAEWEFLIRMSLVTRPMPTNQRTFVEHAMIGLRLQNLASELKTYLAKLDAIFQSYPPPTVDVLLRRNKYRECVAALPAAPGRAFDEAKKIFELYAVLAGADIRVAI